MAPWLDRWRRLLDAPAQIKGRLAVAVAVCAGVALLALAVPVRLPEAGGSQGGSESLTGEISGAAGKEDLTAFMKGRRWGISMQEIAAEAEAAAADAAAAEGYRITPELAAIGFVGLMVEKDEYAVLLVLPSGSIARLAGGDTLPDGRTLVAVTDNSLTLEGEALDGGEPQRDVLRLFPRVSTE